MKTEIQDHMIINKLTADYLPVWLEAFLIDRRSQNLSPNTIRYYRMHLEKFSTYCEDQAVSVMEQVTPDVLRRFLLWLGEVGHNSGGIHGY
jgi:site-specific recombinase XerD